jgi:ribosome-binding ATPase
MLIGIVGKPNCGKSTFFKALTLADVLIANYPFATIEPNKGFGHGRMDCVDSFFNVQCNPRFGFCINHQRFVPVEMIDVAGLVPGAYEGKGMGNQFLDDLRQADCLIHVIDCSGSTNEKGEVVDTGSYDPANDIKFLETELDMWYLGILKKGWEKFARITVMEHTQIHKALAKQLSGLGVSEDMIKLTIKKFNLADKPTEWSEEQLMKIATELRKMTKPMIIAANKIDIGVAEKNLERLKKEFPDYKIIGCSAESELALKEAAKHNVIKYVPGDDDFEIISNKLTEKQITALNFIKANVLKKFNGSGIQKIMNIAVFDLLKYIAIYPGGVNKLADSKGNVLPDCFLMPPNSTALDFAYKLHTDFGKNFIKAIDVKRKIPVGKDHKLNHLDVIEIYAGK